jgi:hypothetical protein
VLGDIIRQNTLDKFPRIINPRMEEDPGVMDDSGYLRAQIPSVEFGSPEMDAFFRSNSDPPNPEDFTSGTA